MQIWVELGCADAIWNQEEEEKKLYGLNRKLLQSEIPWGWGGMSVDKLL
jgi:hypothetical protein